MELQVTLTLSDRLFALLENKLPNLGRRIEKAATKEIGAQTRRESNIEVAINTTPAEAPAQAEAAEETPQAPQPAVEAPAQQTEKEPVENHTFDLTDCRNALARCRDRFEGDDQHNKESERYIKYHKAITNICKRTVAEVSGGSAAIIPDLKGEQRGAFIAAMDALIIDETGAIAPPKAPF